jgi:hypothetical protein
VHACRRHEELCLTCTIFGSAETFGEKRGAGDQCAYGGHVRFGSATSIEEVTPRDVRLAPMGSPHLGSGGFSLEPRDVGGDRPEHDVAAHWGAALDTTPRMLRGRKYYWHSDPDAQARTWGRELGKPVAPRYEATQFHSERQVRTAKLVPAGTILRQRIAVDALDGLALSSLVAALVPRDLLRQLPGQADIDVASHLGGGKPFGLGSVRAAIRSVELWQGGGRYTGREVTTQLPTLSFRRDIRQLIGRCGSISHLMAVARVLDRRGLAEDEALVSYPPAATWDQIGSQRFGESFRYFQENNGEQLAEHSSRPWRMLPLVTDRDGNRTPQRLPIIREQRSR